MIFRKIKITGQKDLKVEVPESWNDVTFKQLSLISDEEDGLKRVSILTNIPVDLFNKYPELADFYVWLEDKLSWANTFEPKESNAEAFILEDGVFNFPKDIGILSIGLYQDIRNEAVENKDKIFTIYPLICASYYQLLKDGEYDYTKANEYVELFEDQPCLKVYNAAGFFLNKLNVLRSGTKAGVKNKVIQMTKDLLALIGFQRYSGLRLSQRN